MAAARRLLDTFSEETASREDLEHHFGGKSLADTVSGFMHEAAKEVQEQQGANVEHNSHSHDHKHHHLHTHGEMGHGLIPIESIVHAGDLSEVRNIEDVLRDIPDEMEASPKTFIYVIVGTMVVVLLLVLYLIWAFNLLDEKKKEKNDQYEGAGGNFQSVRGRGFDNSNTSLYQRRPQYGGGGVTPFANDNAPLGLPRPHAGVGSAAMPALGDVGTAVSMAAQQLHGVVTDNTRYVGDTAAKMATSISQSVHQYSPGLAGFGTRMSPQVYSQRQMQMQPPMQPLMHSRPQQLHPQHPFAPGTIGSNSAGGGSQRPNQNPVFIPPPPIMSNQGQMQGQMQGFPQEVSQSFQHQGFSDQGQYLFPGQSVDTCSESSAFYGSLKGHNGYASDGSDRGSVSSAGSRAGRTSDAGTPPNSAATARRGAGLVESAGMPVIINQGESPAGFGFGNGGLRGSGPLINVLRANAKAGRPDGVNASQKLTAVAGRPPPAPRTAPLSFVPLQEDLVAQVAGSDAAAAAVKDMSGLMMSALPSLQIGDLAMEHVLGGGAFGQVWRGTWRGTPVAVKVLSGALQRDTMPEAELKAFVDEVSMLARLRHPNICLFMGVCIEPPNRAIVTELVTRGSLWDVLRTPDIFNGVSSQYESGWPSWAVRKVLDGTCKGLLYLHSNTPSPIIHRDLKSANILLDDSFNVKICDFGLARLRDFSVQMTANVGTVQWMAPEVLLGKNYAESADIYSLGMIAWELLTAKCPFESMAQMEIAIQVTQNMLRPVIPAYCSDKQVTMLQQCWAADPEQRLTAAEALRAIDGAFPNI